MAKPAITTSAISGSIETQKEKRPKLTAGHTEEQQKYIDYAWDISHDENFIYLLKAENGALSPTTASKGVNKNGYRDVGLCQINMGYHKKIVNDPRFTDYKWQLEQCLRLYRNGTKFYAKKNIWKVKKFFIWE